MVALPAAVSRAGPDRPDKIVVDWNNVVIGRLREARVDPKTSAVSALVVRLDEDARRRARLENPDLVIPMRWVYGIRRDELTLDRSLDEMRRSL